MNRTLAVATFWAGLYVACALMALAVTPGLPEALGFALPALIAAMAVFWLARRHTPRLQFALAVAAAVALMIGAVSGTHERHRPAKHETALAERVASVG